MKPPRRPSPADLPPTPPGGRQGRVQGRSPAAGGARGGFEVPIRNWSYIKTPRGIPLPTQLLPLLNDSTNDELFERATIKYIDSLVDVLPDLPVRVIPIMRTKRRDGVTCGMYYPRNHSTPFIVAYDPVYSTLWEVTADLDQFASKPGNFYEITGSEYIIRGADSASLSIRPRCDAVRSDLAELLKDLAFERHCLQKEPNLFFSKFFDGAPSGDIGRKILRAGLQSPSACLDPRVWLQAERDLRQDVTPESCYCLVANAHHVHFLPRTFRTAPGYDWKSIANVMTRYAAMVQEDGDDIDRICVPLMAHKAAEFAESSS